MDLLERFVVPQQREAEYWAESCAEMQRSGIENFREQLLQVFAGNLEPLQTATKANTVLSRLGNTLRINAEEIVRELDQLVDAYKHVRQEEAQRAHANGVQQVSAKEFTKLHASCHARSIVALRHLRRHIDARQAAHETPDAPIDAPTQ